MQREVADRVVARAGHEDYGALSASAFRRSPNATRAFTIGKGAFTPPPKVDSAVLHLVPRDPPLVAPEQIPAFRRLVTSLFSYRRKRMLKALREATGSIADEAAADSCGWPDIDPDVRPEDGRMWRDLSGLLAALADRRSMPGCDACPSAVARETFHKCTPARSPTPRSAGWRSICAFSRNSNIRAPTRSPPRRSPPRAGTTSAQVRKDLSFFGSFGKRGLGYDVHALAGQLRNILGLTRRYRVILVGAGRLAGALVQYAEFGARGFDIVAVVDQDPAKIGTRWGDLAIADVAGLERIVARERIDIAILVTPAEPAQALVDRLVAVGRHGGAQFRPGAAARSRRVST